MTYVAKTEPDSDAAKLPELYRMFLPLFMICLPSRNTSTEPMFVPLTDIIALILSY